MSEIKVPTVGRQVHFFPISSGDWATFAAPSGVSPLPGTVVEVCENTTGSPVRLNLSILTLNPMYPIGIRHKVPHKSSADIVNGEIIESYWDWPVIK